MGDQKIKAVALQVLDIEAKSILSLKERINDDFVKAVELIQNCSGKLILTGMGKSGQIARKLASTFSSTGTPAVFLHPAESSHGDLGIISQNDVVMALSYGGESPELSHLLAFCSRKGLPLIAMTGKPESSLGKAAQYVLNIFVSEEACPLGLAPTASSTATLAMGDSVAMAVMENKKFSKNDFAEYHPGGSLGAKLLTRVKDLMHSGTSLPFVELETPLKQVFSAMTHRDVRGTAGVLNAQGELVGVITDGDIRRRLDKNEDPFSGIAKDMMNSQPRSVDANELAEKALFLMEEFKIQVVFVFDKASLTPKKPVGMLNFQDLLKAKIR